MRHRLALDRIKCDGYGMCAEILPELIALDDWGYPILRAAPIPEHLLDLALRAVDVCPVLALRLDPVLREAVRERRAEGMLLGGR
jgi:ferredoxin